MSKPTEVRTAEPLILTGINWMQLTMSWLEWTLKQINAGRVVAANPDDAEQVKEFQERAVKELQHLVHSGHITLRVSPLVLLRSEDKNKNENENESSWASRIKPETLGN